MLSGESPLVSIITVNYNQLALTKEMLTSLRQQDYSNYEIILVDNASKVNPERAIQAEFPEVKFIRSDENLGFAGGNNLGIKECNGEYLFFVNNDTELTQDLIQELVNCFDQIPKLGVVSPLICYFSEPGEPEIIQYAGTTPVNPYTARNSTLGNGELNQGQFRALDETPYAHGAAMMIPRKVIEEVGMMPEAFFLYYEELDWCEQIRNAGYKIFVQPNVKIYHKESAAVGPQSPLKTYYINRNRILFMRRNKSTIQFWIFSLFFLFITFPRWVLTFALKRQWHHLSVFIDAIRWNLNNKSDGVAFAEKKLFQVKA